MTKASWDLRAYHTTGYSQTYILLKCAQITLELHIILNFLKQQFVSDTSFTWTPTFQSRVLTL
jgi:hypothetical protein